MMDADELNKIVEQIRKDYLLIPKGKLWTILGGFIGILSAAGLITYESVKSELKSTTAARVQQEIQELKVKADEHVKYIEGKRQTYEGQLDSLSLYFDRTKNLAEEEIPRINRELAKRVSYDEDIEIYNPELNLNIDVRWSKDKRPTDGTLLQVYSKLGNPAQTWRIRNKK